MVFIESTKNEKWFYLSPMRYLLSIKNNDPIAVDSFLFLIRKFQVILDLKKQTIIYKKLNFKEYMFVAISRDELREVQSVIEKEEEQDSSLPTPDFSK